MRSFCWATAGAIAARMAATPAKQVDRSMDAGLRIEWSDAGYQLSVGSPTAFQAMMPPARWASYGSPADCAISDAVTDRLPERQANTTWRPCGSGIPAGSNSDIGRLNASG